MKHVLIARFLLGLAAVSLSAAVMALVIQNHRLKSDFALLNRTMSSRIPVPAALDVGDSIRQMTAIDSTGSRRSVSQIAAPRDRTIFHFLSLECGACSAELPAWSDYLAQHGNEGVIFITVDESEIPKGVPGLDLPSDHIFAIARDPGKPRRTFRVPHTVVADSCGVVVRVVQRVADL